MSSSSAKLFNFNLTKEQEERARRIHEESIIIDLLFHGPLSPDSISDEISEKVKMMCERYLDNPMEYYQKPKKMITKLAIQGDIPNFKEEWYASGITAGNREIGMGSKENIIESMADVQMQFDSFPWLVKALTIDDIRKAKETNLKAGIITAQETEGLGKNLDLLDALHNFGLRILQLTYNTHNYIGSGCGENSNGGLTNFGIQFIKRMNDLGIVVDTGHCGKQTTLDACKYSQKPVIASHTGAEEVYFHYRNKSDEEIKAIADTGGVVGVYAMPWFLCEDENNTTVEDLLDHIEYIINLVGIDHVGIGTDWPMSDLTWSLVYFKENIMEKLGFKKGDGAATEKFIGLEKFSNFINITRGLVSRGYSDEEVKKILGSNWLRVFNAIW